MDNALFFWRSASSSLQLKPLAEPMECLSIILIVVFGSITTQPPMLVQSNYGSHGNFELVIPPGTGGLAHFWHNNDGPPDLTQPWIRSTTFGLDVGQIDSIGLIQSNLGSPGHLEVLARTGDHLLSFWRDETGWHGAFPVVAAGKVVTGISGNLALIQSRFGWQGNFELVVPLATGGLAHYSRINDDPAMPWSEPIVFGTDSGQVDAVALIESNFGIPGNLEVVARVGDRLIYFWRDPAGWHGSYPLMVDGQQVNGIAGNPALIQSNVGKQGNFELVVPLSSGIARFWRNNDDPTFPWFSLPTINISNIPEAGMVDTVALIQSTSVYPGSLQLVAHSITPRYDGNKPIDNGWILLWRDAGPAFAWSRPVSIVPGS